MQAAYQQKIVKRIKAAWANDRYLPIAVEAIDGRSWQVEYVDQETGECVRAPLSKRELREKERHHAFRLLSHLAFPAAGTSETSSLKKEDAARIHQLVRTSISDYSDSPVKILAAFLDTLVLNVYPTDKEFVREKRSVDEELQKELTILKEQAQAQEKPIETRFTFPEKVSLNMTAKGSEGFQWILRNTKMSLAINRGSKMELLAQVRCSSEYLWSVRDVCQVISDVHRFLIGMFGEYIILQVSACDLAVDVLNLDLTSIQEVKRHFVTRAQYKEQRPISEEAMQVLLDGPEGINSRWDRLTGLPFGSRKGAVSALIYDKYHRIRYSEKEKEWMFDIWAQARDEHGNPVWDGEATVWRIELRFRRDALSEMKQEGVFHGIDDVYDLEARLPGLWSYGVGHVNGDEEGNPDGWMRYIVPTEDTNRSRYPVHPDWKVIQQAFQVPTPSTSEEREQPTTEQAEPVDAAPSVAKPASDAIDIRPYIRKRKRKVRMEQLISQIAGCVVTVEAWREQQGQRPPTVDDTFEFVYQKVTAYMKRRKRNFVQAVEEKRNDYSIEQEECAA